MTPKGRKNCAHCRPRFGVDGRPASRRRNCGVLRAHDLCGADLDGRRANFPDVPSPSAANGECARRTDQQTEPVRRRHKSPAPARISGDLPGLACPAPAWRRTDDPALSRRRTRRRRIARRLLDRAADQNVQRDQAFVMRDFLGSLSGNSAAFLLFTETA